MKAQNFINYTLISLICFSGFLVLNKIQFGYYGLSWGSLIFCAIFTFLAAREFIINRNIIRSLELLGLGLIAFIFFSKGWILLFKGLNSLYLFGLILIFVINLWAFRELSKTRSDLADKTNLVRLLLRTGILLFLLSEVLYVFNFENFIYVALAGLVLTIITFLAIIWLQIAYFLKNQTLKNLISIDSFNSFWLLLGFLLFFSYRIAVHYEITDEVRFRRLPPEYVDLFYQAESGDEEPVDGKYEYEIYLENYEAFMDEFVRTGESY